MQNKKWKNDLLVILKSKSAKKAALVLAGLFALRLGMNWIESWKGAEIAHSVKVSEIATRTIDKTITLPGNVEAVQEATLFAHVSGYLNKILVDEGDTVKKNQLLAIVDAPDVIQEYRNAKAEYTFKETTRKRYEELVKEHVVSQQEYDKVDADANQSKARYENASANQDYTYVRAPFAGSIARRFKYPGDFISAPTKGGNPSPLFLLVNESELRIAVNIPQKETGSIAIGHHVDIKVDTFPDTKFEGTISRIDAQLDESTKTERILVDLDNPDSRLHAGMFASVVIHVVREDNVIMVQKDAILTEGEKSAVFLVKDDSVTKVPVELGDEDAGYVELKSTNPLVSKGQRIVVSGGQSLVDGEKISVAEVIPSVSSHNDSVAKKDDILDFVSEKGRKFSHGSVCAQNAVHNSSRSPDDASHRGVFDVENASRHPSDISPACSDGGDDLYGNAR